MFTTATHYETLAACFPELTTCITLRRYEVSLNRGKRFVNMSILAFELLSLKSRKLGSTSWIGKSTTCRWHFNFRNAVKWFQHVSIASTVCCWASRQYFYTLWMLSKNYFNWILQIGDFARVPPASAIGRALTFPNRMSKGGVYWSLAGTPTEWLPIFRVLLFHLVDLYIYSGFHFPKRVYKVSHYN